MADDENPEATAQSMDGAETVDTVSEVPDAELEAVDTKTNFAAQPEKGNKGAEKEEEEEAGEDEAEKFEQEEETKQEEEEEEQSSPPDVDDVKKVNDYDDNVEEETDSGLDFTKDAKRDMTLGRRIALALMNKTWYYHPEKVKEQAMNRSKHQEEKEQDMDEAATPSQQLLVEQKSEEQQKKLELSIKAAANEAYPFSVAQLPNPSLEEAWVYFEHFTLARYMCESKTNQDKEEEKHYLEEETGEPTKHKKKKKERKDNYKPTYDRAEPGENEVPTKLYNPFCTPHRELGDWGLGIGLYFTTMRNIGIVTLVAFLVSLPNAMYFASDEYDANEQEGVEIHLKGSAICTDTSWVPCLNCEWDDFPEDRIGMASMVDDTSNTTSHFVLKNNCNGATLENGVTNFAVLVVVILGIYIMNYFIEKAEVAFDEDEQTAQDYSIVIRNPPPHVYDPQEYKDFFYKAFDKAHVTACTIGVDNDLLVRYLLQRRENLRWIEMKVPPGTPLDTLTIARLAAEEERERNVFGRLMALLSPGIPEHFAKVVVSTGKIQGLAQRSHDVSNVFITFETEAAQRRVLEKYSIGKYNVKKGIKEKLGDDKYLFHDTILDVKEPEEPSAVRWHDLNESGKMRRRQQAFTILTTCAAIVVIALIVRIVNDYAVAASAFVIAIFNTVFPMFAKLLTALEAHRSETDKQKSLYFKVALFRWVNTAVVITIITPFTYSLQDDQGLIRQVYALFFAEIVTNTGLQILDIGGHIARHYSAPRAKNQWSMNLCMQGGSFDLSERYTNMTKFLLLAVWYNAIFPSALLLCSLCYAINYFVDRFSLMRTWQRVPHLGPRISQFSREYFFSLALVAMALLSSYYWSGFPFDNICEADDNNSNVTSVNPFVGDWVIDIKGSGNTTAESVSSSDPAFVYCKQDFFRYYDGERSFPFTATYQLDNLEWMTSDQEKVSYFFGWGAVLVLAGVILKFIHSWVMGILHYYNGSYEARGEDQDEPFSIQESISAYIPQIYSPIFSCPLLACNIDDVDKELLDWETTDPKYPYSFYDLTKDAEFLLRGKKIDDHVMFSLISHWPPTPEDLAAEKEASQKAKEEAGEPATAD